ncbi:hypothetical protein AVEN_161215-1 [Araneus ventricosus]|uniref:Uncharacterized protein n=1 Tax=Araneus ventricosus TaxID=182803 RepID=A0A4Y2NDF6_ARAVE|nr:hypothetical protein AVEN_161215-1 [Araneus ventricosus]
MRKELTINELLDSYSKELAADDLIEIREQIATINVDILNPDPIENEITFASLTEVVSHLNQREWSPRNFITYNLTRVVEESSKR